MIQHWSGGANGSGITAAVVQQDSSGGMMVAHVSTSGVVVPTVVAYVSQWIWVLTTVL
jgi:hypothetical protein